MTADVVDSPAEGEDSGRRFSETREDLLLFRGGDRWAGDRLVGRLRPQLATFVHHRLRRVTSEAVKACLAAEDIVQDALAVALAKLHSFDCRGPGAMLAWLRAIADNQVSDHVDYWRMQKRAPERIRVMRDASASGEHPGDMMAARGGGPRTQAEAREQSRVVATALAELPEDTLQVVMLRVYYDTRWEEIAECVGLESGEAARKRFARALPALAPRLRGLH